MLLFDGGEEPLATFGEELCAKATKEIERTGVQLRMRSRVTDVKADAIIVEGPDGEERVACHTKVWSAGVQASPLGALLGRGDAARAPIAPGTSKCSPTARCRVTRRCSSSATDVAERAARSRGGGDAVGYPRRAHDQTARGGRRRGAKPFVYRDLGSMATVSRFRAIVSFKGIKVGGFIGWLMWAFVHLTFLTGFKNRWIALSSG